MADDAEMDMYDEFGNYIGDDLDDSDDDERAAPVIEDEEDEEEDEEQYATGGAMLEGAEDAEMDEGDADRRVVLHEDKKYYPTALEVYGEGVETTVQEEDTQPITQPIVAPIKPKKYDLVEKGIPDTVYDRSFLQSILKHPGLVRNVCLIGHMHHGKTSLIDNLVEATHEFETAKVRRKGAAKGLAQEMMADRRYTDSRLDEQQRGISIKASPMTLLLRAQSEKHYAFNLLDTPGHVNFQDEVTAAMRLADGVLLVVDAVEGLMPNAERLLRDAVSQNLRVVLCLNKLDRLILELKLPPQDAYFKIRQVIEEVNVVVSATSGGAHPRLSPEEGSVIFASSLYNWAFTLSSFANVYAEYYPSLSADALSRRLWGDVYYHSETRTFRRSPPSGGGPRSFVQFVLEPLYKLLTQAISCSEEELRASLLDLGVRMSKAEYKLDPKPLLKLVMSRFLGESYAGLVDALVQHLPSPVDGAKSKVEDSYSGAMEDPCVAPMLSCDADGLLMVNVTKMYHKPDCENFDAFGRVLSGTLRVGQQVKVLGETYTLDDQEDSSTRTVSRLWLHQSRYRIEVGEAPAGSWVSLGRKHLLHSSLAHLLHSSLAHPLHSSLAHLLHSSLAHLFHVSLAHLFPCATPHVPQLSHAMLLLFRCSSKGSRLRSSRRVRSPRSAPTPRPCPSSSRSPSTRSRRSSSPQSLSTRRSSRRCSRVCASSTRRTRCWGPRWRRAESTSSWAPASSISTASCTT